MAEWLKQALCLILDKHAEKLPSIRLLHFDPFNEGVNESFHFGSLEFRVRPLLRNDPQKSQLLSPASYEESGDDFSDCQLFSFVAWDHVSWPGNDFYGGQRVTDDGIKAAATNVMQVMTGIEGSYDPQRYAYDPPEIYRNWGEVVSRNALRLRVQGNLVISLP